MFTATGTYQETERYRTVQFTITVYQQQFPNQYKTTAQIN
jgi:hypothetical protein